MDHKKEHRARAETWKFYKEKVVDFLRITCGLKERFSEEEILHVLGALDVNSVRIHAAADNNIPVSIYFRIDCYINTDKIVYSAHIILEENLILVIGRSWYID